MRKACLLLVLATAVAVASAQQQTGTPAAGAPPAAAHAAPSPGPAEIHTGERHFRNLRQLTFGGENAEGYWGPDGKAIVYQHRDAAEGVACDQEYVIDLATGKSRRVSDGKGRVTCGYLYDGGRRVLYGTTALADAACPAAPDMSKGYVWPMHAGYDIVSHALDGSAFERLTDTPGYDAEATLSPDGRTIVFTSVRDGDLEIYTMATDGTDRKRLTHEPGYDGGPFFSPDGKRIVYRRDSYADDSGLARYQALLAEHLYRPGVLEIWVMDRDGSNKRQVTRLGAASFAPFFHPDGKRILFSSNHPEPRGRNFDIWMVSDDGSGLEQITTEPAFDGFPMFSPDGRQLVFASNRGGRQPGETNLFLVDWVE
jgi:TolB protein